MHDLSHIRATFPVNMSSSSSGKMGVGFGGILPNRAKLSSAGSTLGGLGVPRHGNLHHGLTASNMPNVGGTKSESDVQGKTIYYQRRAGSAQNRQRGKAGAFRNGERPSLTAIQNTESSLLANLGAERLTSMTHIPGDRSTVSQSVPFLEAAVPLVTLQLPRTSSAPGAPGSGLTSSEAAAAAAAAAVLTLQPPKSISPEQVPSNISTRTVSASSSVTSRKKSVRWSESLTKCSPEKSGLDPSTHMYTSILAVGGMAGPPIRMQDCGANTGVGGLGVSKNVVSTTASDPTTLTNNTFGNVTVLSVVASSTLAQMEVADVDPEPPASVTANITGAVSAPVKVTTTPITSITTVSDAATVPRHRPLLEMRRSASGPVGSAPVDRLPGQRPSLSEQLAAISASAGALTATIRANAGLDSAGDVADPPILVLPAKAFSVGTLSCRYPSPARFYRDRIEYTFHHPFEASEILMNMHYSDMIGVQLIAGKLKFKLPRRLMHFSADFNPNNPSHAIVIELGTTVGTNLVRDKIMPLVSSGGLLRR